MVASTWKEHSSSTPRGHGAGLAVLCGNDGYFPASNPPQQLLLSVLTLTDSQGKSLQLEARPSVDRHVDVTTPTLDPGKYALEIAKTFTADDGSAIPVGAPKKVWTPDPYKRSFWSQSRPAVRAV